MVDEPQSRVWKWGRGEKPLRLAGIVFRSLSHSLVTVLTELAVRR
jgi:hypothetical protein